MLKRIDWRFAGFITIIIFVIIIALVVLMPMIGISDNSGEKAAKEAERVITKALQQCYALEGSYPADLSYLRDHYGITINTEKYIYLYDQNGISNINMGVQVLPKHFGAGE